MNENKFKIVKGLGYLPAICLAVFIIMVAGREIITFVGNIGNGNDESRTNSLYQNGIKKSITEPVDSVSQKQKEEYEKSEAIEVKNRIDAVTKKLRMKYDDVENITWYYDKSTPIRESNKNIHLYFGKDKNNSVWLRLRIRYFGSRWLFIDSYTIKTDDDNFEISTSLGEVERDNGESGIWEWYDTVIDSKNLMMIESIISSKNVKIRYHGNQYYSDRIIPNSEIIAMKNVLDAYHAFGGELN